KTNGSVRLKIVGDGPLRNVVQAAASKDDRIVWLGQRPFEEVLSILGKAAALVFPSVCYETFGRTIIESFSKGTPVIASRHGAMAELIEHERTGWLFNVGDADALASKLGGAPAEMAQLARMRAAARYEFEKKYTASANYEMLMRIYHEVISSSNQRPALRVDPNGLPDITNPSVDNS
ncbi:MAG: glycosyltransferase family 4 protein, partial [Mariniblastus sp.]|nr:glycosyltransferase family 4 protein [Mariniblastus sp.]